MSFFVSIAHMGQYFKKKRAAANGIALSGVGIGTLVLPPIFRLLLDSYGLQGALLVMAGISLNVCVAGALLRPISTYRDRSKAQLQQSDKKGRKILKSICGFYTLIEWSLLKKYSFLLYGVSMLIFAAGFPTYFVTIPAFAEQVGLSKVQAAYLLSFTGMADIIGRISIGFLADFSFHVNTPFDDHTDLIRRNNCSNNCFYGRFLVSGSPHFCLCNYNRTDCSFKSSSPSRRSRSTQIS